MVNLQAQLAYLKEQAAQSYLNGSATENPNEKYFGKPSASFPHDLQGWFQMGNSNIGPQFLPDLFNNSSATQHCVSGSFSTTFMDPNPMGNYENSGTLEESLSFSGFDDTTSNSMSYDMQPNNKQWGFHEVDDLQSMAFGFSTGSSS